MTCSTVAEQTPDVASQISMTEAPGLITVQPGGSVVSEERDAEIMSLQLGSCLSFVAYDPQSCVGGMTHCLLPDSREGWPENGDMGWYVDTALPDFLGKLERLGADAGRLEIAVVGGARIADELLADGADMIGPRNVEAARMALERHRLHLRAAWTGGRRGRSVRLFVRNGRVEIKTASGPTTVLMGSVDRSDR